MYDFYHRLWNPSLYILADMERNGVRIDAPLLLEKADRAEIKGKLSLDILKRRFPEVENWNSGMQIAELLYDRLGLPIPRFCGTKKAVRLNREQKRTTDEVSLTFHSQQVPELKHLLRYRKITKLTNDFMRKLPRYADTDGRIHCQLAPETATGRLTSRNPNLQQIPSHDEFGIREGFTASDGNLLVVADYSQLEMFILAHYCVKLFGDYALAEDLNSGDVHAATAARCWPEQCAGVPLHQFKENPVTARLRDAAKTINYAVNYGKTASGLGAQITDESGQPIGRERAQEILDTYFTAYPAVLQFQEYQKAFAHERGFVSTLLGRTRALSGLQSEENWTVASAERQAFNTPIQGSAADVVTSAMVRLGTCDLPELQKNSSHTRELINLGARLSLQIHDELIFEAPEENADAVAWIVKQGMEHPFRNKKELALPLRVDVAIGKTWGECK